MKKEYSLDFSIERDTDRLVAVEQILDTMVNKPTPSELEQMASYILFGKDENGLNGVQRGEMTDSDKRYKSYKRAADKVQSLDEILDNPLSDQQALQPLEERYIYLKKKPAIQHPKRNRTTGQLLDVGDSDIPGMQQLWDDIARLEHVQAVNEGKIPPDENTQVFQDDYRFYQFKHMLIDVRRHQYYLKDAYKPTIRFLDADVPRPQTIDWDSDSYYWMKLEDWQERVENALTHKISKKLEDYETQEDANGQIYVKWVVRRHTFDWENPKHIKELLNHYSNIYMQVYDKLDSWGRTLIYDFDRYFDMCDFSPLRTFVVQCKIDGYSNAKTCEELQKKFGVTFTDNHISVITAREVPQRMALEAKKQRLLLETPFEKRKMCYRCGQFLPRDTLFFARNNGRKDGFCSGCKDCEKKRRIELGGQTAYDRRKKESTMLEMQTTET